MNRLLVIFLAVLLHSCSTELDNYAEPDGIISGNVINANTGEGLQTEIGDSGTRMRLLELSWSDNPTPQFLYSKQDGSFINEKIFEGTYNISPEGAFVPIDQSGIDESKEIEVRSGEVTNVDFEVEPLLQVEWVGEPELNDDGSISVQVRITRGTDNPAFQPDMNAVFLFVNNTRYLGNNNWDNRYSNAVVYGGTTGNDLLGEVITLTTNGGELPGNQDYYLRVGARTNYGLQLYNYNEPIAFNIPSKEE